MKVEKQKHGGSLTTLDYSTLNSISDVTYGQPINDNLGGLPKGATVANSLDEKRKIEEAAAAAVKQYHQAMLNAKQ
jgi:hypothetical protein